MSSEKLFQAIYQNSKIEISGDSTFEYTVSSGVIRSSWHWDGVKLIVKNDRYGFYPIYYYSKNNEVIVSNSMIGIAKLCGDLDIDEEAMAVFLRNGYFIGEDTFFHQIRLLPPNSTFIWQNGTWELISDQVITSTTLKITVDDAIDAYADLFQKAVERSMPSNEDFVVPLSGGRDSRHIILALHRADRLPAAGVTIAHPPPRSNEDVRIASLLCNELKIPHVVVNRAFSRFDAEFKKNVRTDLSVYEHGWFMPMAELVEQKWPVVYDGIAGDVLSAGLFLNSHRAKLLKEENYDALADDILEPEGFLPDLLRSKFYKLFDRGKARQRVVRELVRHKDAANPIGSFAFWNRTRRAVALSPFKLFDPSVDVIVPYLDPSVVDFLSSLPAEMFLDHEFHTRTISRTFPEFEHIPYENKSLPPTNDINEFSQLSRDIYKYSLTPRDNKIIRRSFFALRHLIAAIDRGYLKTSAEYADQAILLLQLERSGFTITGF